MAVEQIDSFLSSNAERQFELIKTAAPELISAGKAIVDVNKQIAAIEKGRATSTKELKDSISQLEKENAALIRQQKEYAKLSAELERQKQQELRTSQETVKLIKEEAKALAEEAKQKKAELALSAQMEAARKREQKAIEDASDAYKKLDNEHKKLVTSAKSIGVIYGVSSKQFQEASARANELRKRLEEIDNSLGFYQRNVGNYASGFSVLNTGIQQIVRELPNFGQSFEIGLRSITNNIGQLADGIKIAQARNAELIAQGKQSINIFKQVALSVFSWQTALVAIVGILAAYGTEIKDYIFGTKKAKDTTDEFEKSIQQTASQIADETKELNLLLDVAQDVNLSYEERGKAVDTLQKNYEDFLGSVERDKILSGDILEVYDAIIEKIIQRAKAQAQYNEIARISQEVAEAQLKLDELSVKDRNTFVYANEAYVQSLKNTISEGQKEIESITRRISANRDLGASSAYWADQNEKKAYEQRQANQKAWALMTEDERKEFDKANKNREKALEKSAKDRAKLLEDFQQTIKEFANKNRNGLSSDFDFADEIKNVQSRKTLVLDVILKAKLDESAKQLAEDLLKIETDLNNELEGVYDRKARGRYKNEKDFQQELTQVVRRNAFERLDISIKAIESEIKLVDANSDAYNKLIAQLAKLRAERAKLASEKDNPVKDWSDNLKELLGDFEMTVRLIQQLSSEISALFNESSERRLRSLDEEQEKIRENGEKEIENLNKQALTAEEREKRIQISRAKTDAQEKLIEQRKRQEQLRQARFNKTSDIANAISTGALAVLTAMTDKEIPYYLRVINAVLAGGIAAAQVARISSTPLPSYAEGTLDHPGGKARVGEAGPEMIVTPDGKIRSVSRETVLDLPQHSKVFNEDQLKQMRMFYPKMFKDSHNDYNFERLEMALEKGFTKLDRTIKRKNNNAYVTVQGVDNYKKFHTRGK